MAIELDLVRGASFKEIPFLLEGHSMSGGRKDVINSYVNSDRQSINDVGLKPRSISITAIITGDNYFIDRNRLLSALEEATTGTLVHPFFGAMPNMKARVYNLTEDFTSYGIARFEIQFDVSEPNATPQIATDSSTQVVQAGQKVKEDLKQSLGDDFKTDTFSLSAGIAIANEFIEDFQNKTKAVDGFVNEVNAINAEIREMTENIVELILFPAQLANSVDSLYNTVLNSFNNPIQALDAMISQFGFDGGGVPLRFKTRNLQNIQSNNDVFNATINAYALANAYEALTEAELTTIQEIEYYEGVLEGQYINVINSGIAKPSNIDNEKIEALSREAKSSLTTLRTVASQVNAANKTLLPDVVSVERIKQVPLRVLEYRYYGNNEQTEELRVINQDPNESFYSGTVGLLNDTTSS